MSYSVVQEPQKLPFPLIRHFTLPWPIVGLMGLFGLGLFPLVNDFVFHHPDERHYTDAALHMLKTGDWWVPCQADGTPRFQKPILTYWVLAVSYWVGGVSPLASRLPFLLAGCGVLWLTYRMGKSLFGKESGILAALILMTNPIFLLSSTRSIPDIYLCLFLTLSAWGFLLILTQAHRSMLGLWMFYGGVGLAVATKGLPGLLFLICSTVFAWKNPWKKISFRQGFHWSAFLVGMGIALGWYLWALFSHGESVWHSFWNDQVTHRLAPHGWQVMEQGTEALIATLVLFLPWSFPVALFGFRTKNVTSSHKPYQATIRMFCLLWIGLWIGCSICTITFKTRYLLPLFPLVALMLADGLLRLRKKLFTYCFRLGHVLVLGGIFALISLLILIQINLGFSWTATTSVILAGTLGGFFFLKGIREESLSSASCLALNLFLVVPLVFLLMKPFALPDQGRQIAENLETMSLSNQETIGYMGKYALASKIRVCSQGRLTICQVSNDPDGFSHLLVPDEITATFEDKGYHLRQVSVGYRDVPFPEVMGALFFGTVWDYLSKRIQRYYLATKP